MRLVGWYELNYDFGTVKAQASGAGSNPAVHIILLYDR